MALGLGFVAMLVSALVPSAIVAAATAPALLVLWLAVAADSRPEPPRVVLIAFVLGALSVIPVGLLELWLKHNVPITHNPWLAVDVSTLFFVGIPEETFKISIIVAIALRARDFDEPMDGVVYGAAVGLGFAALENVLHLVRAGTFWEIIAIVRGVLSVPFHGALGAIAGAYIARARFGGALNVHSRWRRPRLFLLAWLIPVALHSLFDASLFSIPHAKGHTAAVLLLSQTALIAGFGAIAFAVLLARRITRHQKLWLQTKRLPPAHWRGVWAECLIGVGLSFVALTLGIAGSSGVKMAGWALLVGALGISWKCGRYLKQVAINRHRSATTASTS